MSLLFYAFLATWAARGFIPISHETCNREYLFLALFIPLSAGALDNKWANRIKSFLSIWGFFVVQAVNIMLWAAGLGMRGELDILSFCMLYYLLGRSDEC